MCGTATTANPVCAFQKFLTAVAQLSAPQLKTHVRSLTSKDSTWFITEAMQCIPQVQLQRCNLATAQQQCDLIAYNQVAGLVLVSTAKLARREA